MATEEKRIVLIELELDTTGAVKTATQYDKAVEHVVETTNDAVLSTNDYVSALRSLDSSLGKAASTSVNFYGKIKTLITGLKGVKLAIAATGIGALVVVLGSLVTWFSRSEKGAATLSAIMKSLGDVLRPIVDLLTYVGEFLAETFFPAAVREAEKAAEATKKFNDELERTAALTDKEAFNIYVLTKAVQDLTKSESERIRIAGLAEEAIKRRFALQIEALQDEKELFDENGKGLDSYYLKVQQLADARDAEIATVYELSTATVDYSTSIEDNTKEIEANKKAFDEWIQAQKDEAENAQKIRNKKIEEWQKADQAAIEGIEKIQTARDFEDAKRIEDIDKRFQTIIALTQDEAAKELENLDLTVNQRREIEAQLTDDLIGINQDYYDAKKELRNKDDQDAEDKAKTEQAQLNEALGAFQQFTDSVFSSDQGSAAASVILNTAAAVMKTLGVFGGTPAGWQQAALVAALGLAQLVKVNQEPPPVQKAEFGGLIGGNLHTSGGTLIEAEAGEVILNRRSMANPYLRSLASDINKWGGGIGFAANGGIVGGDAQLAQLTNQLSRVADVQVTPVLVTEDFNRVNNKVMVTESISTL